MARIAQYLEQRLCQTHLAFVSIVVCVISENNTCTDLYA